MDKGLLQRELAEIVGVTEQTVMNWEVRNVKPMLKNMKRIRGFIEIQ